MANPQNLKPLKKGFDPRRNLKGVPKDAIAARKAIREIGAELVKIKNGDESDAEVTRFYVMIRAMFQSRAPADRQALLKALAPGLLTDNLDLTTGGKELPAPKTYITVSPDDWDKMRADKSKDADQ